MLENANRGDVAKHAHWTFLMKKKEQVQIREESVEEEKNNTKDVWKTIWKPIIYKLHVLKLLSWSGCNGDPQNRKGNCHCSWLPEHDGKTVLLKTLYTWVMSWRNKVVTDWEASSLLASFHGSGKLPGTQIINILTQLWAIKVTGMAKYFHEWNGGMNVIWINNCFLIGFKTHRRKYSPGTVNPAKNPCLRFL